MDDLVLGPLVFAFLAALTFAPLERLWPLRKPPGGRARLLTDMLFASVGSVLTRVLVFVGLGGLLSFLDAHGAKDPLGGLVFGSGLLLQAASMGVGLLLFELGGYAYHRLAHGWSPLWRLHRVHHSSTSMDWLAAFRQHPLEITLMTLAQNAPLVLLGIPLTDHALIVVLLRLHTVFVHVNVRLPDGFWDELVAMPNYHQRHHDRSGVVRNYASLFPWIDRLFGTHSHGRSTDFGVDDPLPGDFTGLLMSPLTRPVAASVRQP
ncbi:MAG: sterol desaturase family protein [Myxococcales bacterium]|nr:sterol desaturase family protein [Myxococcales bacterium]